MQTITPTARKKRVGIIGRVGFPTNVNGYDTLVHNLVLHLNHLYSFTVYYGATAQTSHSDTISPQRIPFKPSGWQGVVYQLIAMIHSLFTCDVLMVIGIKGSIFLPVLKTFTRKKIIVNISGMRWNQGNQGFIKRLGLKIAEHIAAKYADEVLTDNYAVKDYLALHYCRQGKWIAYGGDQALASENEPETDVSFDFLNSRYALAISQIEPHNHVEMVLHTFAQYPKYHLVMLGNWNASKYGQNLRSQFSGYENIHLLDSGIATSTLRLFRKHAHVYIHNQPTGKTHLTLVEAMSAGLPVIAYDVPFTRETTADKARYFFHHRQIIFHLESMSTSTREEVARDLKEVAARRYTWARIATQYHQVIHACLYPGSDAETAGELSEEAVPQLANKSVLQKKLTTL